MASSKSVLPLPSHPIKVECFSSRKVSPRFAAKLLADSEDELNNTKMRIGLFMFDDESNEWKHTGDVFEHVWTGDWDLWDRQCYLLFNRDSPILYAVTRDNNTLYALDASEHLKVLAKVDLPFRPGCHTLSLTPSNSALYIRSTFPWVVGVYNAKTLRLLGTAPSGRFDFDAQDISLENKADIAKIYNPSTAIAHRRTNLTETRIAVVIDTPELCCVSHELVCRLSSHVDLVFSGDGGDKPWLLDLKTLRTMMVDLVGGNRFDFKSDTSKIVFRECSGKEKRYKVLRVELLKYLDAKGHLSADAPAIISVNAVEV